MVLEPYAKPTRAPECVKVNDCLGSWGTGQKFVEKGTVAHREGRTRSLQIPSGGITRLDLRV